MKHHCLSGDIASLLHEVDVGQHFLMILSDGSIELFAHEEQTPASVNHGIHLDAEETYRLFISLHDQFQPKGDQKLACDGQTASQLEWSTNLTH